MNASSGASEQALLSLLKLPNLFSGGDLAAIQEPEGLTGSSSLIGRVGSTDLVKIIVILSLVRVMTS